MNEIFYGEEDYCIEEKKMMMRLMIIVVVMITYITT